MAFDGFTAEDFSVFQIEGLDPRMEAIISKVRPKLEALGNHFAAELSNQTGEEIFAHVAKHARRSVNPPDDTWVAFAPSKRGYKMLPHFQIGLWETHVFIWFAVIYEAPVKEAFGKQLKKSGRKLIKVIPDSFVWSEDHTKPAAKAQSSLKKADFDRMFSRLEEIKKAEILCGVQLAREEAVNMSGEEMLQVISETFGKLIPLYKLAQKSGTESK
ncbi:DUF1054 domain-containing protein [Metabacillus sp. GX 13764]|uniref:YktB family protein n=1 Tax=Metabacillus kandeliae TaxID=2900151 RepID=UPI001E32DF47|nr:DUF1054 domain-containing protein [Metabacillus kandeliae]MCD7033953.1 DUF1054 domain-containing protein [Metabacillus kandeliae]